MINVTKTFFPALEEYEGYLKRIWKNEWLTNRGELVLELEDEIKNKLNIERLTLTTNGTLPLQIALNSLEIKGEVITTPFSYVATVSTIVWEGLKPVFVDIDEDYFVIDETKIEAAITSKTVAILATHVFGNPCNVNQIERIAKKHDLKVIYDAAHCFGVKYKGKSVFTWGDISTCSFHATKIFHTGEGGCFVASKELHSELYHKHNFGHNGQEKFYGVGINAKMSELNAAMGLSVLNYFPEILEKRKLICELYDSLLCYSEIKRIKIREHTVWNYHYYPVVFKSEEILLKIVKILNDNNIYPRRYFYPSLNNLPYVDYVRMPVSESISKRVICLPLFYELKEEEVKEICNLIKYNL
jgi:dTDP-4-amino-4,6-dideoxygalactose transaminase